MQAAVHADKIEGGVATEAQEDAQVRSGYLGTVLFRLVSTELLEGDFYTCANTKHKKDG
jgi:hypothetical protein